MYKHGGRAGRSPPPSPCQLAGAGPGFRGFRSPIVRSWPEGMIEGRRRKGIRGPVMGSLPGSRSSGRRAV